MAQVVTVIFKRRVYIHATSGSGWSGWSWEFAWFDMSGTSTYPPPGGWEKA